MEELNILEELYPLYVHDISKIKENECILCDLEDKTKVKMIVPIFTDGKILSLNISKKEIKKRVKFRFFYNFISKLKRFFIGA